MFRFFFMKTVIPGCRRAPEFVRAPTEGGFVRAPTVLQVQEAPGINHPVLNSHLWSLSNPSGAVKSNHTVLKSS